MRLNRTMLFYLYLNILFYISLYFEILLITIYPLRDKSKHLMRLKRAKGKIRIPRSSSFGSATNLLLLSLK